MWARLITKTRRFDNIPPVMVMKIHWFPVRWRVYLKILTADLQPFIIDDVTENAL